MPYASVKEVPDYVSAAKKKQWLEVWNSAYKRALADGKSAKDAEASAFAQANAVADKKVAKGKHNQVDVGYEANSTRPGERCGECVHFEAPNACEGVEGPIAATGWCLRFDSTGRGVGNKAAFAGRKAMTGKFRKFIPFAKVDAAKREVWGVVTAEVPDKDDEVCDYFKSKPYYEAVIAEMSKATDGGNVMPLRYMHQLEAVGKGIGYELRDDDREVFMGFKVVDDDTWKLVEEKVLTGFSHGGVKVGDMVPDPVYKNCMRYVANPSEVSLVDNPCLGVAHFTYVSKTGEISLRKNRSIDNPVVSVAKFESLVKDFETLKKSLYSVTPPKAAPTVKPAIATKRVAGEDLPAAAFLIVGEPARPDTWYLPVELSTEKKSRPFVRAAIVTIDAHQASQAVRKRLDVLAEKHGLSVAGEKEKYAEIRRALRNGLRSRVNKLARTKGDVGHTLTWLDDDLGRLSKGMYEVGCLAQHVSCITNLLYNVVSEQEWEGDSESQLPAMLEANVNGLLDSLVEMVAEETRELREELARRND
jgi:hypothetical protein